MRIKEYYKLTKSATTNCLKISGLIFTTISVIIWGLTEGISVSGSIIIFIKTFILCFLTGNTLGLFITGLAFAEGYLQVKNTIQVYNSIPFEIRDKYDLKIFVLPLNPKYNYLKMRIYSRKPKTPVIIIDKLSGPARVQLILAIGSQNKNFPQLRIEIDKRYRKERINLIGWGLCKTINWKNFKRLSPEEIDKHIDRLLLISGKEEVKPEFN